MADHNYLLWKELLKFYSDANANKNQSKIISDAGELWKKLKNQPQFPGNVREKILELKKKAAEGRGKLDAYWVQILNNHKFKNL